MFVQLCDLCLKPLAMRAVFGRVNRLSLERGVFRPKRIYFLPKPIVFRSYVFALAHPRIVACRHELWGTRSNIYVRLMRSRTRIAGTANPTMSSTGGLRSSVLFRASRRLRRAYSASSEVSRHPQRRQRIDRAGSLRRHTDRSPRW
ncbi:MAG: hypothetical protein JF601_03370 [Acidobacteria bacterium]|nr:hypothetical protein [Acidobacteriota bacterium]